VHASIARLRRSLSAEQKEELLRDVRHTTDWIADVARQVAAEEPEIAAHG
jgi:hypothetical protein